MPRIQGRPFASCDTMTGQWSTPASPIPGAIVAARPAVAATYPACRCPSQLNDDDSGVSQEPGRMPRHRCVPHSPGEHLNWRHGRGRVDWRVSWKSGQSSSRPRLWARGRRTLRLAAWVVWSVQVRQRYPDMS